MKLRSFLFLLVLAAMMVACGGGASGPRDVLERYIAANEDMAAAMEKAGSAGDVVAALNSYSDKIEKIAPEMKAMNDKNPELKNMFKDGNVPPEYKDLNERINKLGEKMMTAMTKMGQYMQDEAVQKAQTRWMEVMAKLN